MPMAALLAQAGIREGTKDPAPVVVVQRNSGTSGWKVGAINQGRSPIGGVEPALDEIVQDTAGRGMLSASHDYGALADADVILIAVQTDRNGKGPDYKPLFEALTGIAMALQRRPPGNVPLIIFESTLAPSSMTTVVREHFARFGLEEGRDVLLGNSPNRVMPGRLVERVAESDKIVAGLHPETPGLIARIYARVVTRGRLHQTNSLTAEVVKTLENAYRDVRIAYATEIVRACDADGIDFFDLRDRVNAALGQSDRASRDSQAVPSGGLLVPGLGVGGHCLPKDGVLLWWRALEAGRPTAASLILESRRINDESPGYVMNAMTRRVGSLADRRVALLGAAYRGNSEDTRNSPSLVLARLLLAQGAEVMIHDPYVPSRDQNLDRFELRTRFTDSLESALEGAAVVVLAAPHQAYRDEWPRIESLTRSADLVYDAANLLDREQAAGLGARFAGIGKGNGRASENLVESVIAGFRAVETGVANEVNGLIQFLNQGYGTDPFNRIAFEAVQTIAATCPTGCAIASPEPVSLTGAFPSRLVACATRG
jgi:UDP-N-acetyl-D-mannosaminuronic acid dehydrogenase